MHCIPLHVKPLQDRLTLLQRLFSIFPCVCGLRTTTVSSPGERIVRKTARFQRFFPSDVRMMNFIREMHECFSLFT